METKSIKVTIALTREEVSEALGAYITESKPQLKGVACWVNIYSSDSGEIESAQVVFTPKDLGGIG